MPTRRPGQLVADNKLLNDNVRNDNLHPLPTFEEVRASQRNENQRLAASYGRVATSYPLPSYLHPFQQGPYPLYGTYYPAAAPQHQMAPQPVEQSHYSQLMAAHGQFLQPGAPQDQHGYPVGSEGQHGLPTATQGQDLPQAKSTRPAPRKKEHSNGTGWTEYEFSHYINPDNATQQAPLGLKRDGQPRKRVEWNTGTFKCALCGSFKTRKHSVYSPHFVRCIKHRGGCSPYARWDDDQSCWTKGGQGEAIPPGYNELMTKLGIVPYDWKTNPEGRNTNVTHNKGPGGVNKHNHEAHTPRIPPMAGDEWRGRFAGMVPPHLVRSDVPPTAATIAETTSGGQAVEAGVAGTGAAAGTGGQQSVTQAPGTKVVQVGYCRRTHRRLFQTVVDTHQDAAAVVGQAAPDVKQKAPAIARAVLNANQKAGTSRSTTSGHETKRESDSNRAYTHPEWGAKP